MRITGSPAELERRRRLAVRRFRDGNSVEEMLKANFEYTKLRVGDAVAIRRPPFEYAVVVKDLSDKRGPAAVAATLYEETVESRARRTVLAAEMKSLPQPRFKGRPTKKTRRDYERWLRSGDDE